MGLNVDGSPRKTVLSEGASLRGQRRGVSGTPEWQRPRGAVWPPVPGRAEAIRPGEPFLTAGQHRELRSLVGFAQRASSVVVGSGSGELRPRSPGPWKATRAAASGGRRAAGRGGARRGLRAPASRSAMCGLPPPPRIADAQSAGRRARRVPEGDSDRRLRGARGQQRAPARSVPGRRDSLFVPANVPMPPRFIGRDRRRPPLRRSATCVSFSAEFPGGGRAVHGPATAPCESQVREAVSVE